MANGQTDIPWDRLVSNLSWSTENPRKNPDIRLLSRPTTEADLSQFAGAFTESIQKASAWDKRAPIYSAIPEWEEIIITDDIVERIAPTVRRTLHDLSFYFDDDYADCEALIPRTERESFAFLRPYSEAEPPSGLTDGEDYPVACDGALYNAEIVKVLLVHGEMDAITTACVDMSFVDVKWWVLLYDGDHRSPVVGWDHMIVVTLRVYIGLHALHRFVSSPNPNPEPRMYRDTRAYQYLLRSCTITRPASMVATHPHRDFFGIADGQFSMGRAARDPETKNLVDHTEYGLVPFEEFLAVDGPVDYMPGAVDVRVVQSVLAATGLPMELVLSIMDYAGYATRARLVVSHDPFHPLNKCLLEEHLEYCWGLLVRCNMLGTAWRQDADWEVLVRKCIVDLFTPSGGRGSPCETEDASRVPPDGNYGQL